jgi:hypothetical protein
MAFAPSFLEKKDGAKAARRQTPSFVNRIGLTKSQPYAPNKSTATKTLIGNAARAPSLTKTAHAAPA